MKVYITRDVLCKGILEVELKSPDKIEGSHLFIINEANLQKLGYSPQLSTAVEFWGEDWFSDIEDAVKYAEKIRERKINTVQMHIDDLKERRFTVDNLKGNRPFDLE